MNATLSVPTRFVVAARERGVGRAAAIRELYVQRCNFTEIKLALGVTQHEINRTLLVDPPVRWVYKKRRRK